MSVAFALSVTRAVIEVAASGVVGVPEITPPVLRDNPTGNVPDVNAQTNGVVPPVVVRVCEKAVPSVNVDNEVLVILGVALIVSDIDFVADAVAESVTWKVTEVGPPVAVGVPEMTPLELNVIPAGNVPDAIVQP